MGDGYHKVALLLVGLVTKYGSGVWDSERIKSAVDPQEVEALHELP